MSQVEDRDGELRDQLPDDPPEFAGPPEWAGGPEITESELAFLLLRRSAQDYARIMDALQFGGSLTVIPDTAPEQLPEEPPPEE